MTRQRLTRPQLIATTVASLALVGLIAFLATRPNDDPSRGAGPGDPHHLIRHRLQVVEDSVKTKYATFDDLVIGPNGQECHGKKGWSPVVVEFNFSSTDNPDAVFSTLNGVLAPSGWTRTAPDNGYGSTAKWELARLNGGYFG